VNQRPTLMREQLTVRVQSAFILNFLAVSAALAIQNFN
jgi:hypothetical protein